MVPVRNRSYECRNHGLGIDPHTIVCNHLNQPRELVDARFGDPVTGLFV